MTTDTASPPPTTAALVPGACNAGSGKLLRTKRQLAEDTGLPTRSIERLTANGVIPSLRITKKLLRYELPAVMAALRKYQTATLKK